MYGDMGRYREIYLVRAWTAERSSECLAVVRVRVRGWGLGVRG